MSGKTTVARVLGELARADERDLTLLHVTGAESPADVAGRIESLLLGASQTGHVSNVRGG